MLLENQYFVLVTLLFGISPIPAFDFLLIAMSDVSFVIQRSVNPKEFSSKPR